MFSFQKKIMIRCLTYLKQPAFLVGLILGLSLSTLLSQILLQLEFHKIILGQAPSEQDHKGYVSITIPVNERIDSLNKNGKPEYKSTVTPNYPPSKADMRSIVDLIVNGAEPPSYVVGVIVVQTDSYWGDLKEIASTTWGANVPLIFHQTPGEHMPFGTVGALNHLCRSSLGNHNWYLILNGSTYINMPVLHVILQQLAPDQDIVIAFSPRDNILCDTEYGFLISQAYLQKLCSGRGRCQQDLWKPTVDEETIKCTQAALSRRCLNVHQAFPAYGTATFDDVGAETSRDELLSRSVIIKLSPTHMQEVHSVYTQTITRVLQKHVTGLAYQISQLEGRRSASSEGKSKGNSISISLHNKSTCNIFVSNNNNNNEPDTAKGLFSVVFQASEGNIQEYKYLESDSEFHESVIDYEMGPLNVHRKYVNQLQTVHIVSQVPADLGVYQLFLQNVKQVCKTKINKLNAKRCEVYMVLFKDDLEVMNFDFEKWKKINDEMDIKHGIDIKVGEIGGESFSLGRLLLIASDSHNSNDLLLFVDAHYRFNGEFLDRCSVNAEMSSRVYYPIAFLAEKRNLTTRSSVGTWMDPKFDTLCVYTSDIQNLDLDLLPTKFEELHQAFSASETIEIFSAPDISLSYYG